MAQKIYVLDTNVLVHDPQALYAFGDATVVIPVIVLEQLDAFKREGTDRGRAARQVIRELDALREKGSLGQGVPLDHGGAVKVVFPPEKKTPMPLAMPSEDNIILYTALVLQQEGAQVCFVSKDLNARVKADALGIAVQDYAREVITEQEFYKGWRTIAVPAVALKSDVPQEVQALAADGQLVINEYVIAYSQHNPHNYRVFRSIGGKKVVPVLEPSLRLPLHPRNAQQLMAFDALFDPAIELVVLFGPAGTGKTFLALLAGLHKVLFEDVYEKLLVARPVVPLGRDIGYLPGTLQEKLYTWMLPVYDTMELIMHTASIGGHLKELEKEAAFERRHGRRPGDRQEHFYHEFEELRGHPLEMLVKKGKLSLEAITYMRGRSIPYQYIFIDEVQNLTPHEVKTLVSRVGEGSKIILAGDPYQIDSPYLDFSTNGLVVTSEKFKGQKLFATIYLEKSERSQLSELASKLL